MLTIGWLADLSNALTNLFQLTILQPYSGLVLTFGICVLIVVFTASVFYYWRACHRVRVAIVSGTSRLNRVANGHTLSVEWDALKSELSGKPILGEPWSQFSATILTTGQRDGTFLQIEPIESFFDFSSLLSSADISPRLHRAVPNILVGIGLLFTFLGLIIALGSAGDSVGAPSPEVSRSALKGLLDAASVKFVSSLLGLLLSIMALLIQRFQEGRIELAVREFGKVVTSLIPPATSLFLIEQTNDLMRESLNFQKEMFSEFPVKFGECLVAALDETLGRHLAAEIGPLRASMDRMAETTRRMNQDALERMVQQFGLMLQETAGAQMRELADVLGQAANRMAEVTESFSNAGVQLRSAGRQAARELQDNMITATKDMRKELAASQTELRQVCAVAATTLSDGAEEAARQLRAAAGSFSAGIEPLWKILADLPAPLRDAAAAVAAQVDLLTVAEVRLGSAATGLQAAAAGATDASEALVHVGGAIRETATVLQAANAQGMVAQEGLREAAGALRISVERFEGLDREIASVFAATETGLRATTDRIASFAESVDNQTARAVTALSGAITDLREVVDDLSPLPRRGVIVTEN